MIGKLRNPREPAVTIPPQGNHPTSLVVEVQQQIISHPIRRGDDMGDEFRSQIRIAFIETGKKFPRDARQVTTSRQFPEENHRGDNRFVEDGRSGEFHR